MKTASDKHYTKPSDFYLIRKKWSGFIATIYQSEREQKGKT